MRKFARLCLVGVAVASSVLLLSGCVQPAPVVTDAPAANSKPLFASDEDALAAATKAYAAYLQMSDLIGHDGGADPARLTPLVTRKWLREEVSISKDFVTAGNHQDGATQFDHVTLQRNDQEGSGGAVVAIYVCVDISGVRVLDQSNNDVTPPAPRTRYPFVATFTNDKKHGNALLLEENSPWAGKDFC